MVFSIDVKPEKQVGTHGRLILLLLLLESELVDPQQRVVCSALNTRFEMKVILVSVSARRHFVLCMALGLRDCRCYDVNWNLESLNLTDVESIVTIHWLVKRSRERYETI